jgi:hypothetical protein
MKTTTITFITDATNIKVTRPLVTTMGMSVIKAVICRPTLIKASHGYNSSQGHQAHHRQQSPKTISTTTDFTCSCRDSHGHNGPVSHPGHHGHHGHHGQSQQTSSLRTRDVRVYRYS